MVARVVGTLGEVSLTPARGASFVVYKSGVSSSIDVLDADRRLLETRDSTIQARAAASRRAVASFRALGGGYDTSAAVLCTLSEAHPLFERSC